MHDRTQITATQFAVTLYPIAIGTIYFPAAGIVVPLAGTAGWMAVLLAFTVSALWVLIAAKLCRWAPAGNFATAVVSWLGPWIGRAFLVHLLAIGLWLGGLLMLQGSLVFHAIALPATPPLALTLSTLLLIILTDLKGVEVYLRTVQFLLFLSLPLIVGLLFGLLPSIKPSDLLPLFGKGPAGIAHATYLSLPWAMDGVVFTLFFGCLVQDKQSLTSRALLPIALAGLTLAAFVSITVVKLGLGVTETYIYPSAQLALGSGLGGFLQGLELFFYPLWLVTTYVKSAAFFLLASESTRGLLPSLSQPWRAALLGACFLAISLVPKNINEMVGSIARVNNSLIGSLYWILPLLFMLAWRRRRKQDA